MCRKDELNNFKPKVKGPPKANSDNNKHTLIVKRFYANFVSHHQRYQQQHHCCAQIGVSEYFCSTPGIIHNLQNQLFLLKQRLI